MRAVLTPLILAACHGDSIGPDPVLVWTSVPSGATQRLTSVWGSSASDVWAVGYETILHYDGKSWSNVSSSLIGTGAYLWGVWGTSPSNVWAVGYVNYAAPTILHYNGTSWSSVPSGTTNLLLHVWGSSPSDVWAVGNGGTIVHYNGSAWSTSYVPSEAMSEQLSGVWGVSASDVWVAGGHVILHYNGTDWSLGSSAMWVGVVGGTSASDVWAASSVQTLHYDGAHWSSGTTVSTAPDGPTGFWGSSPSNLWAVTSSGTNGSCCGGTILRYDGTAWSLALGGVTPNLWAIWGSSRSNIWVVGEFGTILHGTSAS